MAIEQQNRTCSNDAEYDFEEASYVLAPQGPAADTWMSCDQGDEAHGEMREPEVFETEHHVYTTPFRYANVELRGWSEGKSIKGPEFLADIGSIAIVEEAQEVTVSA